MVSNGFWVALVDFVACFLFFWGFFLLFTGIKAVNLLFLQWLFEVVNCLGWLTENTMVWDRGKRETHVSTFVNSHLSTQFKEANWIIHFRFYWPLKSGGLRVIEGRGQNGGTLSNFVHWKGIQRVNLSFVFIYIWGVQQLFCGAFWLWGWSPPCTPLGQSVLPNTCVMYFILKSCWNCSQPLNHVDK